jgi:glycosyltransferase involved in cell wall biosynthesis
MKILLLSSNISNEAGGYSESSFILRENLDKIIENETFLFGFWTSKLLNLNFKLSDRINIFSNYFFKSFPFSITYLKKIISFKPDIIDIQGLWNSAIFFNCIYYFKTSTPYIITPRGMLQSYSLKKSFFKKILFFIILGRYSFNNCSCIRATSLIEAKTIRNLFKKKNIVVVPNAVKIPKLKLTYKEHRKKKKFRLLFLSRIHKKKGIVELLHSWKSLENKYLDWELLICGFDSKHKLEMINLASDLKLKNVLWQGYKMGKDKERFYLSGDLFILPSYSENFGLVVAEALAHGLPVITTNNTPWTILNKNKCGWCISLSIKKLVQTLSYAMELSSKERFLMGQRGRKLVLENFSSSSVAEKMQKVYKWILKKGPKPSELIFN